MASLGGGFFYAKTSEQLYFSGIQRKLITADAIEKKTRKKNNQITYTELKQASKYMEDVNPFPEKRKKKISFVQRMWLGLLFSLTTNDVIETALSTSISHLISLAASVTKCVS